MSLCTLQGGWSCSALSRWSCAPSRRCGEVLSCTWFRKPGSFFSHPESASRVHFSRPQRWMEVTRDLYSLKLLAKLMVLHHQILLAWPLLPLPMQSWCGFLLSRCHPCTGLLPGTWSWSPALTCPTFKPFMLIPALILCVLLVMILFYSVLTSIQYAIALSTSLLVRSPLLPAIRSMLSANRRLHMVSRSSGLAKTILQGTVKGGRRQGR